MRSTLARSQARSPTIVPTSVVKNTASPASAERGASPSSVTWKIGPRAMIGNAVMATATCSTGRSSRGNATASAPSAVAMTLPQNQPGHASRSVVRALRM